MTRATMRRKNETTMNKIGNDNIVILRRGHVICLLAALGIREDQQLAPIMAVFVSSDCIHQERRTYGNAFFHIASNIS